MDKLKRRKLHEILFQNFRKNLFDLPRTVLYSICGIDMVVYLLLDYRNTSGNVVNHGYYMDADMIFIVSFLGPLNILWVLRISENKTREIGAGLAWSFYYGYLKITAPYFEESIREAGLEESDVLHKRVVLIPEKDGILDSIEDADHRIEFVRNTPALRLNIAGMCLDPHLHVIYVSIPSLNPGPNLGKFLDGRIPYPLTIIFKVQKKIRERSTHIKYDIWMMT